MEKTSKEYYEIKLEIFKEILDTMVYGRVVNGMAEGVVTKKQLLKKVEELNATIQRFN
jgi:hypothetical protein